MKEPLQIAAVTSCRSDFGVMRPVYELLAQQARMHFTLLVTGSHFFKEFGGSFDEISNSGLNIEMLKVDYAGSEPRHLALTAARILEKFSTHFAQKRYDLVMVMGDRYEILPVAYAGLPFNQVFAHVHGGELTLGAIDESVRHSLTKLCHLHFVANPLFAKRVKQMGEEPWRIKVTGSPAIDTIKTFSPLSREALMKKVGLSERPFALLTLHAETIDAAAIHRQTDIFFSALENSPLISQMDWLASFPAPDTHAEHICQRLQAFAQKRANVRVIPHMGRETYLSAMAHAGFMIGNSSSGFVEAPSFGLPVINMGDRQQGRPLSSNIRPVPFERKAILAALKWAQARGHKKIKNPYGDGRASLKMLQALRNLPTPQKLLRKKFTAV